MEHAFQLAIGERVVVVTSGEVGEVIGRAEFKTAEDSYLVRYRAGDARAVEAWWGESALASVK